MTNIGNSLLIRFESNFVRVEMQAILLHFGSYGTVSGKYHIHRHLKPILVLKSHSWLIRHSGCLLQFTIQNDNFLLLTDSISYLLMTENNMFPIKFTTSFRLNA